MISITSRRELRPRAPEGADVQKVRVSRDLRRMAYVRADGDRPGLYLEEIASGGPPALACEGEPIEAIGFSPDGACVAYVAGAEGPFGRDRSVAWADAGGEIGRVSGAAFAWAPDGSLIVADLEDGALVQYNVETAVSRALAPIQDDGDAAMPPRLVVSPKGRRVAMTCQKAGEGLSEVWLVERERGAVTSRLLTQVPGTRVHVMPFWSPKGMTLGLSIVHVAQDQSAIIVVRGLKRDGEILHTHELLDAPDAPAWAPSGDAIAFFVAEGPAIPLLSDMEEDEEPSPFGPQRLALLDCRARSLSPVPAPDVPPGALTFLDGATLLIEGGAAAHVLAFDAPP
jgi:hypothetical protein